MIVPRLTLLDDAMARPGVPNRHRTVVSRIDAQAGAVGLAGFDQPLVAAEWHDAVTANVVNDAACDAEIREEVAGIRRAGEKLDSATGIEDFAAVDCDMGEDRLRLALGEQID